MAHRNQDIVGENCVRNAAGKLALTDEDKMKAWVEHYARAAQCWICVAKQWAP